MSIKYQLDQITRSLDAAQESIDEARTALVFIKAIEEDNVKRN